MTFIRREIYGEGPPLVMLHGWAMHSGVWRDFARRLSGNCQVICLDLPGHGRSEAVEPYTLDAISEVLLQAVPASRFQILGWSLGATIAMAMAERFPERVDKLSILAGNPHFVQGDDWPGVKPETLDGFSALLKSDVAQTLVRFLALQVSGLAHGKSLLKTLKQVVHECPPPKAEILQAGLEILKTGDLREFILRTRMPVKMIMGGRDTLVPVACARRLQQINPNIEVEILDSAGHVPFLSHPDCLQALILDSL